MTKFKDRDFVRLSKKAIKDYYGTNNNVDGYKIGGEFKSEHFVDFVEHQLSFENGKNCGMITGFGVDKTTYKVSYFGLITGRWAHGYYDEQDLVLVRSANEKD
jgi:hypothetical protein